MTAAIVKFGITHQMDMVTEECAELIQAINKYKRKTTHETITGLYGEIADVEIMCAQLRLILDNNTAINRIKDQKLVRLQKHIKKF
jgi:NTP pyrophosphatase (non-canonical NTP hydrolase)